MWERGILSCVNAALAGHGVASGTSVQSAVKALMDAPGGPRQT
jgi:hypothetical protein